MRRSTSTPPDSPLPTSAQSSSQKRRNRTQNTNPNPNPNPNQNASPNPTTTRSRSAPKKGRNAQCKFPMHMPPLAPVQVPLVDRDVMAIVDAYKCEPANTKYAFRHLLFSVTDPPARKTPLGVSDIMWGEAIGKLKGMESADRERLWPQLVESFKDLSQRIKIQDEVIASDAERLHKTPANVNKIQRHCQANIIPWVQRLKQKERNLQMRLLRLTQMVEILECKGLRLPLTRDETNLSDKLASIHTQVKGPGNGLSARVNNLLVVSRIRPINHSVPVQITEQSYSDMQALLQQQTDAISRVDGVLNRDARDVDIIERRRDGR